MKMPHNVMIIAPEALSCYENIDSSESDADIRSFIHSPQYLKVD